MKGRLTVNIKNASGDGFSSLIFIFCCVLFFVSVSSCGTEELKDDEVLFSVREEPVTAAEYLHIMSGLRSEVYSYFSGKYGQDMNENFWSESFNGEIPSRVLKEKTLSKLKKIKTEQSLFKQYGIAADISYSCFLRELDGKNQRRKVAAANNLPVYGPLQYDEKVYYDYVNSERRHKLMKLLSEGELKVSETEILEFHRDNPDYRITPLEETRDLIRNKLTEMKYEMMIERLANKADLTVNEKAVDKLTLYYLK